MTYFIRQHRWLITILVAAFLIRIAAAIYLGNTLSGLSGASDEITYSMLGHRFVRGFGLTFPTEWYPWIHADAQQSYFSASMSLLLALIYATFGYQPLAARLVMACLSTLIVFMIYLLANKLFDKSVALIAALVAAFYAYLIFYGTTLVTETPFILALLVTIYIAIRIAHSSTAPWWHWLALSVSMAVTVLFRMAIIFYIPFLLIWLVMNRREYLKKALLSTIGIVLAVAPFTIHNYQLWGRFLLLESQVGHVFWNGNHPDQSINYDPTTVYEIPADILASNNDAQITNELLVLGIGNVLHDPAHFLLVTLGRLREFFKFWPTDDSVSLANLMRVMSFGVMLPLMVIGIILTRREWKRLLPIYLFLIIHTAVYATSWAMIRYRIPMDALLIIFGAYTLHLALYRWSTGTKRI